MQVNKNRVLLCAAKPVFSASFVGVQCTVLRFLFTCMHSSCMVAYLTLYVTVISDVYIDFGAESVVLGLLLVLLAKLLGTGVFLVNIDTVGRRVLLLTGA